eukprot:1747115-Prymnesium_polylepis.1
MNVVDRCGGPSFSVVSVTVTLFYSVSPTDVVRLPLSLSLSHSVLRALPAFAGESVALRFGAGAESSLLAASFSPSFMYILGSMVGQYSS